MKRTSHFSQGSKRTLYWVLLTVGIVLGLQGAWACTPVDEDDGKDNNGATRNEPSGGKDSGGNGATTNGATTNGGAGASAGNGDDDGGTDTGHAGSGGSPSNAGTSGEEGGSAGAGGAEGGAAGSGPIGGTGSGVEGAEPGSWTYLVYMLADNDLEPFALEDLKELMAVGSSGKLTILAQVDRAIGEAFGPIGGLQDFTSTKRVRVNAGELEELNDLGEVDMGRSDTLADFLEWGVKAAPAEHYAVVFWDHGAAWPQFGVDFSHNYNGLNLPELLTGLDQGLEAGELLGPFDVVGFDACLMATWEVAVSLEGRARYLLASEEVEPGHGWDHHSVATLKNEPTPEAFGRAMLQGYGQQAVDESTFAKITLSFTAIDAIRPLTRAIQKLTTALGEGGIAEHAPFVGKSRARTPTFGAIPGGESSEMTDLLMFVEALAELDPSVSAEVAAVREALAGAVVDQVVGNAYPEVGGLSIYFPERQGNYSAQYDVLPGINAWRSYVAEFYGAGEEIRPSDVPEFVNEDTADAVLVDDGIQVSGQLRSGTYGNLSETLVDFGVIDTDGWLYFLGQRPANVTSSGLVSASWDFGALAVVGETNAAFAYHELQIESGDVGSLSVPFVTVDENNEERIVVLFISISSQGQVLSQTLYAITEGAWAEYEPQAAATLRPLIPRVQDGSELEWVPSDEEFEQGFSLDFQRLDTGTDYFVRLLAFDYAGNGDLVAFADTL
jgi:hypothetical protein